MAGLSISQQVVAVAGAVCFAIALTLGVVACVLLFCRKSSLLLARIASACAFVSMLSLNVFFGFVGGFELPPWGAALIAFACIDIPLSLICGALLGTHFSAWFYQRDDDKQDDTKAAPEPAVVVPHAAEDEPPAAVEAPEATATATVSPPSADSPAPRIRSAKTARPSRWGMLRLSVARAVPMVLGAFVISVVVTVLCQIFLNGGCFHVNPDGITTWMSRSATKPVCRPGEPCHTYAMLGYDSTSLIIITHFVAESDDQFPVSAVLTVCQVPAVGAACVVSAQASNLTVSTSEALPGQLQGSLVGEKQISEDRRYVARFLVQRLTPDTIYATTTTFTVQRRAAPVATVGATHFRTLPAANNDVEFIGGGDFESNGPGVELLRSAVVLQPAARFIFIGGDLAYANNIRACYRRWDDFFVDIASLRRPVDQTQLPLLVCVGNHEGGGYLLGGNTAESRRDYYNEFIQYFPSVDYLSGFSQYLNLPSTQRWRGDPTITFQRVQIGSSMWILLDSDIMIEAAQQVALLGETLDMWETAYLGANRLNNSKGIRRLVAVYHNPAFPTVRAFDNTQSIQSRTQFFPLIAKNSRVGLVFENHDHAYKTTVPLWADAAGAPTLIRPSASGGNGTIFVGDGSLGVASITRTVTRRWYHNVTRAGNYVMRVVLRGTTGEMAISVNDVAESNSNAVPVDAFVV